MQISELDFKDINTYGFKIEIHPEGIEGEINLPHAIVYISKRPGYCDRGRWNLYVDVKPEHTDKMNIDYADMFPRYFFKLENMFDELHEWVKFNEKRLGVNSTEQNEK